MAVPTGTPPIKQALVRALRDITALEAAVGSDGFHEGVAIDGVDAPYVIYNLVFARRDYVWPKVTIVSAWDIEVVHPNQVEAGNLDQLILAALEDKQLDFEPSSGQITLLCHRVLDLSSGDSDGTGKKLYRVGGSYEIWTEQAVSA